VRVINVIDARETRRMHLLHIPTMSWYVPRCALQLPHMSTPVPMPDSLPLAHVMWTRHATALLPCITSLDTSSAAPVSAPSSVASSSSSSSSSSSLSHEVKTVTSSSGNDSKGNVGRRGRRYSVNASSDVAHLSRVAPLSSIATRRLIVVGGGGICFSFGTFFSPTVIIDIGNACSHHL
jgi:hypothetical protein